jgi:aminotransferase
LRITKPQIKEVLNKRKQLAWYMDDIGLIYLQGAATFYFFVSIAKSRLTSEAFCTRLLNEQCISIVPGSGYGESCDQFVRVSIGTASLEENQYGLDKIKQLIELTS